MRDDERLLVERLVRGDEAAWHSLFDQYYPLMCYLATQYVHDDFLASALASDVMSHLWEIRSGVHIRQSLRSYLLQATRNRCLNYLKSAPELREEAFSQSIASSPAFDEDHPLGTLLEKELEDQLTGVLEKLPLQTRLVFEKSRLRGLSYQQIAEEMGISVHTVKYHIRQALARLRTAFGTLFALILLLPPLS